ncbi:MAG: hypothetical protein ACPL28_01715 [bacterium]
MHTRYDPLFKYKCIQEYLNGKTSLRKIAREKSIHFTTIQRWLNEIKNPYEDLKKRFYKDMGISPKILKILVKIKEENPNLTVKETKDVLKKEGIYLSSKKIWNAWRVWGYAGFNKKYISNMYIKSVYIPKYSEWATEFLKGQKHILSSRNIQCLLASLPVLSDEDFLLQLDPKILPLHHRLAQLYLNFGKKPLDELLCDARYLKLKFLKKKLIYSFLRANYAEIFILHWMGRFNEGYQKVKNTERFYLGLQDKGLCFVFFLCKALFCVSLLKFEEAKNAISICKAILKNFTKKPLALLADMAAFGTSSGFILDAEKWLNIMQKSEEHTQLGSFYMATMASKLANGEFAEALRMNERTRHVWGYESRKYLIMAQKELTSGNPEMAIEYASQGLKLAKRENILNYLSRCLLIIFGAKYALRQEEEVKLSISDYLSLFKKHKMAMQVLTFNSLMEKNFYSSTPFLTPPLRLLLLLCRAYQEKKYYLLKRATEFAIKNRIWGNFLLYSLFFSDLINIYLKKGKKLEFPHRYFPLPIFNESIPYYEISFLGPLKVLKNNIPLKSLGLRPKEEALFIYLCLKEKWNLSIDEINSNFWPNKKNAKHYLYQTISKIRKALNLPKYALIIKGGDIELKFRFITDWAKFNELTAQARALILANEYELAMKKFTEAINLFRGEPFKKNFDDWSVNMRFKILTEFENESINFAKSCLEHRNKHDAKKVLEKVLRVIPDSEEVETLLGSLIV